MLDEQGLGDFIDQHYRSPGDRLFRMECLPIYTVESDGGDYERWRAGATEPTWSRKQPWLDTLRAERDNQQVSRRVRVFATETLSDYELFACNMGYAYNAEFEDIRVLHHGEHDLSAGLLMRDYWIVAERFAVPMHYNEDGRFLGAEVAPVGQLSTYMRDWERAWAAAEPFPEWWSRHPKLHRRLAA